MEGGDMSKSDECDKHSLSNVEKLENSTIVNSTETSNTLEDSAASENKNSALNKNKNVMLTPKKRPRHIETSDFKTPEKLRKNDYCMKTPIKGDVCTTESQRVNKENSEGKNSNDNISSNDQKYESSEKNELQSHQETNGEEGMISEIEQAKLLIAATEKTPVKQKMSDSPQHAHKNSQRTPRTPGTPGSHKRVELITLASPKTKKT